MTDSKDAPAYVSADTSERDLKRKLRRVDTECERRILAAWPASEQLFLLAVLAAQIAGVKPREEIRGVGSQSYLVAREKQRAAEMITAMIDHRHAAEALKLAIVRSPANMQSIDVGNPKYWPAEKGAPNEN